MTRDGDLRYFMGLDLGPPGMPTALAVLARHAVDLEDAPDKRRPPYTLPHLHRFPIGTPYPEIVVEVRKLLLRAPLSGAYLIVDKTGVGKAITRLFMDGLENQVTCRFRAVTITPAATPTDTNGLQIPKLELVGVLQVLLQMRRLQISRSLPNAETLVREFEAFRLKPLPAETTDPLAAWRDGPEDDLVFAVALAAWFGESCLPPLYERPPPPPIQFVLW